MKSFILIVLTFVISISAQANLGGNWLGWGTWKFKGQGDGVACRSMELKWSESKTEISIDSGFYDCEYVVMHVGETKWKIQDGKLYDENNAEVGSYDGTTFEVFMPSPNVNTTIYLNAKRSANHMDYQEIWFNKVEKVYVIEGRLFTSGK